MDVCSPVRFLPGVGEKTEKKLNKLGIVTIADILQYSPRRYREFGAPKSMGDLKIGESALMCLKILTAPKTFHIKRGLSRTFFNAGDQAGIAEVNIFNQSFLVRKLAEGLEIYIYGRLESKYRRLQIASPEIFFDNPGLILPVYQLTSGITQAYLRKIIRMAMDKAHLPEPYDSSFLKKFQLPSINKAVESLHSPHSMEEAILARDRLVFDELLVFSRMLELLEEETRQPGAIVRTEDQLQKFIGKLQFKPTKAQLRVMGEISRDFSGQFAMNRMIQGDVGSGKTAIAFFAMYCVRNSALQSVLFAPTEILAAQHYSAANNLFKPDEVVLVLGSHKTAKRREALRRIASGEAKYIIGTHALLYGKVSFKNLGLIITDEQHRFGVKQRAALAGGWDVHMLTMSATPIPRSLALVLFGKTDISVLDELPPGRMPISTYIITNRKYDEMLDFIRRELKAGRQGYIVCPLIENGQSDLKSAREVFLALQEDFKGVSLALMHGKLSGEEKENTMQAFAAGKVQMLVSTTVVEVGVNIPNATVMCVLNAERFGLAQLHQLRGRVGRGVFRSYCFLVSEHEGARERLSFLCKTQDGFAVAKKDMEMRGGGDVFGTRQHGDARVGIANLLFDAKMLDKAKTALLALREDPSFADIYSDMCKRAELKTKNTVLEIALN